MAKTGPAPQPTALKRLRGNPGRRPLNDAEPAMTNQKPNCPVWLSDYARTVWRRLSPSLFDLGVLKYEDVFSFAAFCESVAVFKRALEELQAAPEMTQEAESGWRGQHPAVFNYSAAMNNMLNAGARFGLDPSSRSKLRIEAAEKELGLADQLFQLTQQMDKKG